MPWRYSQPIATFEKTPYRQKTTVLKGLQILSQVKLVEEANVKHVERAINQLVVEDQTNL
jgi:hypothetical protein